ncbi:retrotransposon protein, putative, ty1-copia subclass [Tanacetum coccineum]
MVLLPIALLSLPYTPQNNGVSERRNRTLVDMVRSMMSQTTLPKSFWDYALETAARILNMVPSKKRQVARDTPDLSLGNMANVVVNVSLEPAVISLRTSFMQKGYIHTYPEMATYTLSTKDIMNHNLDVVKDNLRFAKPND